MKRHDKVNVTTLEAYRLMTAEVISEDDLVDQINRTGPETDAMRIGKEFADLLELGLCGFIAKHPAPMIDAEAFERMLTPGDRNGFPEFWLGGELRGRWIAAKADLVYGREIREFKTTSQFNIDKYLDSLQWRFYLLLGNASRCYYRVFEKRENRDTGLIEPRADHTFYVSSYPGMRDDCISALQEYELWEQSAINRGLISDWRKLINA